MKKGLIGLILVGILLAGCRVVPDSGSGPWIRVVVLPSATPVVVEAAPLQKSSVG